MLVDHALARFSTDNLSVMVVRFDPAKLQQNTKTDIGVENTSSHRDTRAISEVEMIVGEARRNSTQPPVNEAIADDQDSEELRNSVIKEAEEEGQEGGPEYTPEGGHEAQRILGEKKAAEGMGDVKMSGTEEVVSEKERVTEKMDVTGS
jgi:hypothetical protein